MQPSKWEAIREDGVHVVDTDTWVSRTGEEIKIKDMDDARLLATLEFVEKRVDAVNERLNRPPYWERGDHSEDFPVLYVHPTLNSFRNEVRRRGIK